MGMRSEENAPMGANHFFFLAAGFFAFLAFLAGFAGAAACGGVPDFWNSFPRPPSIFSVFWFELAGVVSNLAGAAGAAFFLAAKAAVGAAAIIRTASRRAPLRIESFPQGFRQVIWRGVGTLVCLMPAPKVAPRG